MAKSVPKLNISLAETFAALPESIKDWLASEQCTIFVSEINRKLGLKEEKRTIIPRLIMRLVLKDLEPPEFINELSAALDMNFQAAKALAQEIEEKIFNPITAGLKRDVGVDIKLIYFGKPKPREEGPARLPTAEAPAPPVAKIPEKAPIFAEGEVRVPTPPEEGAGKEPETAETPAPAEEPALIYRKGTFGRIPITKSPPPAGGPPPIRPYEAEPSGFGPKPELKLKVETPLPEKTSQVEVAPKSPPTGGPSKPPLKPPPIPPRATRIVHYSSFLTPLNSDAEKPEPKKEDVILNGNTVDLRLNYQ